MSTFDLAQALAGSVRDFREPQGKDLMATMMQDKPELWAEDIGEEA